MCVHQLIDDVPVEDLDGLLWVMQQYTAPGKNKA